MLTKEIIWDVRESLKEIMIMIKLMTMELTESEIMIQEMPSMKEMVTLLAPRPLRERKDLQDRECTAHGVVAEGSGDSFQG